MGISNVLLWRLISPIFAMKIPTCVDGQCAAEEELSALQMEQRLHTIERESAFSQEMYAYEPKGKFTTWISGEDSLEVYIGGDKADSFDPEGRVVIIVAGLEGWNTTFELADQWTSKSIQTVVPNLPNQANPPRPPGFGPGLSEWLCGQKAESATNVLLSTLGNKISFVGFCYGAWFGVQMFNINATAAQNKIVSFCSPHPSINLGDSCEGEGGAVRFSEGVSNVPILLLPAFGENCTRFSFADDPTQYNNKTGTIVVALRENNDEPVISDPYYGQCHGFTLNGEGGEDAKKALQQCLDWTLEYNPPC